VNRTYFNCDETDEKVVLSFGPMLYTVAIIATEIPPAIMAYSMAVAPESSAKKLRNFANMEASVDLSNKGSVKWTAAKWLLRGHLAFGPHKRSKV
jgi:hypothetical protein